MNVHPSALDLHLQLDDGGEESGHLCKGIQTQHENAPPHCHYRSPASAREAVLQVGPEIVRLGALSTFLMEDSWKSCHDVSCG